jgi:hypothetical protein
MSHTYTQNTIHLVFSTKDRLPLWRLSHPSTFGYLVIKLLRPDPGFYDILSRMGGVGGKLVKSLHQYN